LDNDDLTKLYKMRFKNEELPRKNKIWKTLCSDFFQKFISPDSTVIDIACGYGEFLNNICAKRKIAIDLNLNAKNFLDKNIEFHQCLATDLSKIASESTDVAFTSNFLEHLPDKKTLDLFLDQVLIVLKPGGKYLILGPNLRYIPGKYWDFYDHHLGMTHLSLLEALKLKGFEIEICVDKFLPYTTQRSFLTHPFFVKLYLRLPFVWKIFGKQFFIVARKI
jgi:SAM-dependent methyltransferase